MVHETAGNPSWKVRDAMERANQHGWCLLQTACGRTEDANIYRTRSILFDLNFIILAAAETNISIVATECAICAFDDESAAW
jgi:hypothetical protein